MSHPFKQSASGNETEAERSFGKRSQAKDNKGSRGSSALSHKAGDGEITGSQDGTFM